MKENIIKDFEKEYRKSVEIIWEYSLLVLIISVGMSIKSMFLWNLIDLFTWLFVLIVSYMIYTKSWKKRKNAKK